MANNSYGSGLYPVIWPMMQFGGPVYSTARIENATENAYKTAICDSDWERGDLTTKTEWFELARDFIAGGMNMSDIDEKASLNPVSNLHFFEVLRLSLISPNLEAP